MTSMGGLHATFVLDRAMDVVDCSFRGMPLVWRAPGDLLPAHPGTLSDDAFQRRFFGGLVTTCGLTAFGPAGSDEDGTWGQHGHVNHCPAKDVCVQTNIESENDFAQLRGVVRQARLFGESLRLERSWTMNRSGTLLWLRDCVTNESPHRVPHMILYHCNAGYPLLDERLRVRISQRSMRPRDEQAREGLAHWDCGGPPEQVFAEQVFIHEPVAENDGYAVAELANDGNGLGFAVRFRPEQLPACMSWKMLESGTYVMAVEPANCPTIEGRIAARRDGTLPFLESGETREYELRFTFG